MLHDHVMANVMK